MTGECNLQTGVRLLATTVIAGTNVLFMVVSAQLTRCKICLTAYQVCFMKTLLPVFSNGAI